MEIYLVNIECIGLRVVTHVPPRFQKASLALESCDLMMAQPSHYCHTRDERLVPTVVGEAEHFVSRMHKDFFSAFRLIT